jgi:hypothetical protein
MLRVWIGLQKSEADILAEAALSWILADAGVNACPTQAAKMRKYTYPHANHTSFRHHS